MAHSSASLRMDAFNLSHRMECAKRSANKKTGNNKNAKTLDTFAAELIASGGGCDQSNSSEVRSRNAIDTNTHTHWCRVSNLLTRVQ